VLPHNATDKSLTWTSSNPTAATVNQAGEVTALTIGTTTIRATAKDGSDKYDECVVTVVRANSGHRGDARSDRVTLKEGDIVLLTATVLPDNATDPSLNWTSQQPSCSPP